MVRLNIEVPVLGNTRLFVFLRQVEQQAMSRQQLEDALEHRLSRREVTQGKEFRESATVETRIDTTKFQQSLDFRRERKTIAAQRVIKRFYAETITGTEKSSRAPVPNCKREHAPQMMNAVHTVL